MHTLLAVAIHHRQGSGDTLILYALIFIVGVGTGRLWGRRAGLKHLGEAEFRNRWANVRGIRRW
jgi:hypothetical protein